jgi:hypothetical protein
MYFAANPRMIGSAVRNAAGVEDGGVSLPMLEQHLAGSELWGVGGGAFQISVNYTEGSCYSTYYYLSLTRMNE